MGTFLEPSRVDAGWGKVSGQTDFGPRVSRKALSPGPTLLPAAGWCHYVAVLSWYMEWQTEGPCEG